MPEIIDIGDLSIEVRRSTRRKTISLIVDRGGQLVIIAPQECEQDALRRVIENKKQWIYTKLLDKEKQAIRTPLLKEYISGEGFFYLGKSYRLRIIEADPTQARTPVFRFFRGQFLLRKDERLNGRRHFVSWYTQQCQTWIEPRLQVLARRIGVIVPVLEVIDLGYRWSSCSGHRINFHWRSIMLPIHIIEYLMIHELAHLIEPNHKDKFWQIVERVIPDWQERRHWLAENGHEYVI